MRHSRQSGVALITAMFVVVLATLVIAAILVPERIAIHRAQNLRDSELAWWYADGVESWIKSILQRDANDNQVDGLDDIWAHPVENLPVDQGMLRGRIIDLQGLFNLNNFSTTDPAEFKKYQSQLERLMQNIEGADPFRAPAIAAAVRDWIDKDQETSGSDGGEDTEYLSMNPPYRTPNALMESATELAAVKGMDRKTYELLRPYVTALPAITAVNINTAPEPVLRSLVKQVTPELEKFMQDREKTPAENVTSLQTSFGPDSPPITVKSSYFMSQVEAFIGSGRLALYSFYLRPGQGAPIVLGRSTDEP